eukprot:548549-Lingulodinium_polyedra.AAC.1
MEFGAARRALTAGEETPGLATHATRSVEMGPQPPGLEALGTELTLNGGRGRRRRERRAWLRKRGRGR